MTKPAASTDHHTKPEDPTMRLPRLNTSTSAAAIAASFPRGPRIAFGPETGAGSGTVMSGGAKPPAKRGVAYNDAAEAPAAGDDKMDKLLALMQQLGDRQEETAARLDALEGKGKAGDPQDPGDLTEEQREELAKADGIEGEMESIRGRMPLSTRQAAEKAREDAVVKSQVRGDAAWNLHGKRAPMPLVGETPVAYRVRLASELKKFSPAYKDVDLGAIARADAAGFAAIEDQIYADSAEASKRPAGPEDGSFMVRKRRDESGREISEFFRRSTFVRDLTPPTRIVKSINVPAPAQSYNFL